MTETAVAISGPDRRRPTPPGSVGRPMAGTEVRLVDGELWVRGPQVMARLPERADRVPARRRLAAGPATSPAVDADGNLFIVDRLKDLIKVNALQVAPAELEALLLTHPAVADAAVIGRAGPAHRRGARWRSSSRAATLDARRRSGPWLAERVAPAQAPRGGRRSSDAIPRTPSGKISVARSPHCRPADQRASSSSAERAGVEQQAAVLDAADQRRVAARAARRRARRAGRAARRPARAARAAAARRRRRGRSPRRPRRPRSAPASAARGRERSRGACSIASTGISSGRVAVQPQRRLQRGERELVDPQRARQRMRARRARPRRRGRRAAPPAGRRAACRRRSTRAPRPPRPSGAPAARRTASPSAPEPTSSITGTPSSHSASIAHLLDEPELAEVRLVHAQDRARCPSPSARS